MIGFCMKKLLFTITIILAGFAYLQAETIITNPVIDGDTWVKENSPYLISLDIHIQNLIIEPGVEVLFSDNWTMTVDGSLIANGTFSDSITFMPAPANTQIWQGIVFKSSSYASVMRYCRIEATNKYAISVDACQPAISNCRLIDNTTGGLFIKNTSLSVNNSFFKGNGIAGVWLEKANLTILNSIFSQNGTALYLSNKSDILNASNCVLVNGTTGVRAPNAQVTIINSIIHSNATELDVNPEKTSVTYCCVEDGFPGLGNITADPLFFDQTRFRLQDPSPCKDAGNPAVNDEDRYFPPSLGNRRNDMGAYGGPYAYGWFPPLYIIPQSIAFSRVTQDSSKTAQILLKNYRGTGISILTITPDTIGTGTFAADPSGLYLPFSDSAYINVIFNPDSEKAYSSDLIFNTSTEGTVILPVSGRGVLPHLSTSTDSLNFGEITVNDSSKILVPLTNLGSDTLTVNLNVFQDNIFSVKPKQLTINPDSSTVYLEVTFTPRSAAAFYDSLVINSNDRSNSHLMLPLSGRGLSPLIHSNRNSLEFGEVNLFSPALQYLQISNLGNADLNIDAISGGEL